MTPQQMKAVRRAERHGWRCWGYSLDAMGTETECMLMRRGMFIIAVGDNGIVCSVY